MSEKTEPWYKHLEPAERAEYERVSRGLDALSERYKTRRQLRERARARMKRKEGRA